MLLADAYDAVYAALEADDDPYHAKVRTRANTFVTIRQCDKDSMLAKPYRIDKILDEIREYIRVRKAVAAGEDPYADDYLVDIHDAYDAVYECLYAGEDPEELSFTCYHTEIENTLRIIKLSKCTFLRANDVSWQDLLKKAKDDISHSNRC